MNLVPLRRWQLATKAPPLDTGLRILTDYTNGVLEDSLSGDSLSDVSGSSTGEQNPDGELSHSSFNEVGGDSTPPVEAPERGESGPQDDIEQDPMIRAALEIFGGKVIRLE